jgi:hypothetical protein
MRIKSKWLLLALVLTFTAAFAVPSVQAAGIDGGYVGEGVCLNCHTDKASYLKSGHPYKLRMTGGKTPVSVVTDPATQILDPLSALLTMPKTADLLNPNNETDVKISNGDRLSWSAVEYVVGGFGQKARWGVRDTVDGSATGYIWSQTAGGQPGGTNAQFNMLAADTTLDTGSVRPDWSTYGSATKGYHCAVCHNTNGTTSNTADTGCVTPLGSGRTEPWASTDRTVASPGGFKSEWSLTGVQCEACHGQGSNASNNGHADGKGTQGVLTLAGGVEICAKCHIRAGNANYGSECGGDTSAAILEGGACIGANCSGTGMIGHHEQYNEMMGVKDSTTGNQFDGVHASLNCTTCHDPHKRVTKVTSAIASALGISTAGGANLKPAVGAIKKQCSDCHYGKETAKTQAMTSAHAGITCVDCHMGEATQTATTASGTWGKKGDLKTHVFAINPAAGAVHYRNNAAGKAVAANAMPIEFSCGKCHDTALAESYSGYAINSKADASVLASGYHTAITSIDNGYVGSEVCGSCHTNQYSTFVKAGHPYKYTHTGGATPDPVYDIPGLHTRPNITSDWLNTSTLNGLLFDDGSGKLDWSAVNYTVGGFGWKIRWGIRDFGQDNGLGNPAGNDTGYVWAGAKAQYNTRTGTWSAYSANANKKYECAKCHNTNGIVSTSGYDCYTDGGTNAAPARTEPWASNPGMGPEASTRGGYYSSWTFDGVQCEACHGAGLDHAMAASASNIEKNKKITYQGSTAEFEICAKCHIRSTNTQHTGRGATYHGECDGEDNPKIPSQGAITAAGGFGSHHETFNELFGVNGDGAHASLFCTSCHNPHMRATTVVGSVAAALGITDNHLSAEARGAVVSCQSCHAPGAGGSITKISGTNHPTGVTCIDCHMAETVQNATSQSGTWGKKGDLKAHIFKIDPVLTANTRLNPDGKVVATNYIPVQYACGKCHDSSMSSFVGTGFTREQASVLAANMHNTIPRTASFTWSLGAVSNQVNFDASASACASAPCSYNWNFGDGTTGTGVTTSRTYSAAGNYLVSVKVTDSTGAMTLSPTRQITAVSQNTAPVASKLAPVVSGMTVTITDTSTDAEDAPGAMTATVLCGNSTVATGPDNTNLVCTYTTAGSYTIRHSVKDTGGLGNSSANVTVSVGGSASRQTVSGTLTKQDGSPVSGGTLYLQVGTQAKYVAVSAATTGNFTFTNVLPGTYTIRVIKGGLTFTNPAESDPASIVVSDTPVTGVVVKSIQ